MCRHCSTLCKNFSKGLNKGKRVIENSVCIHLYSLDSSFSKKTYPSLSQQ